MLNILHLSQPKKMCIHGVRENIGTHHLKKWYFHGPRQDKIITDLPGPKNGKEVQAFMGYCIFYRRLIYMYDVIAKPIYSVITAFEWIADCEISFEKFKQPLISASILRALDYNKIFHVHVDASTYAIGCILTQSRKNSMDFPIFYS